MATSNPVHSDLRDCIKYSKKHYSEHPINPLWTPCAQIFYELPCKIVKNKLHFRTSRHVVGCSERKLRNIVYPIYSTHLLSYPLSLCILSVFFLYSLSLHFHMYVCMYLSLYLFFLSVYTCIYRVAQKLRYRKKVNISHTTRGKKMIFLSIMESCSSFSSIKTPLETSSSCEGDIQFFFLNVLELYVSRHGFLRWFRISY